MFFDIVREQSTTAPVVLPEGLNRFFFFSDKYQLPGGMEPCPVALRVGSALQGIFRSERTSARNLDDDIPRLDADS